MDPKIRFAITMSFLVFVVWAYGVMNDYLFGEAGLNITLFFNGVVKVGFSTLCGFTFVAICVFLVTHRRRARNAFEEDTVDEYGTTFNWPIMLSKFVPEIIAPPVGAPITALEQELIGFLNGYRDWPQDFSRYEDGQKKGNSLAATAMTRWHAVRKLKGTSELHHIVALGLDLGKVLSYAEKRKVAPFSKFWKRDKISYTQRAAEHGGFSAFILSTFETFRCLPEDTRQILLITIRYGREPGRIPTNSPKVVHDILGAVQRAEASMNKETTSTEDLASAQKAFEIHIRSYLKGVLAQIPLINAEKKGLGVYLGGKQATLIIQRPALLRTLSMTLAPNIRETLGLWENTDAKPEVDTIFNRVAEELQLLQTEWDGEKADNGTFSFSYNGAQWGRCYVFSAVPTLTPILFKQLTALPQAEHMPEPAADDASLLADIQAKALSIDTLLQKA